MAVGWATSRTGTTAYANRACALIGGRRSRPLDRRGTCGVRSVYARARYPVERLPFSRVVQTGAPVVVDDVVIRHGRQRVRPRLRRAGHGATAGSRT